MKIAIDGPAGAGKSTIAKKLAEELGYVYIDTGAMYRVLTWKALQKGIQVTCETALKQLAHSIKIHFENNSGQHKVLCNGEDLSAFIRLPQVNALVSTVASHPSIRKIMVKKQQDMANNMPVVMDGRDIGECVLPDAQYKFFLTASLEERARRRAEEFAQNGNIVDYQAVLNEIRERDQSDSQRKTGALKILPESIVIDTSDMSLEQVLQHMLKIIQGEKYVL